MPMDSMILTVPPDRLRELYGLPAIPAHLIYRMGKGPHLFRVGTTLPPKGGFMLLDCRRFDGFGSTPPFCQEVIRECVARGFTGIVCDFEGGCLPPLEQIVLELGNQCFRRTWTLIVPEAYGHCSQHTKVMISSALSGGSLFQRLQEAQERFGRDRVVLAVQRVAEDFFLPSPTGGGVPLSQESLQQLIEEKSPSIFFSNELCARYFTYMSPETGAHFVLFDDGSTLKKKIEGAHGLGIHTVLAAWPEVADVSLQLGLRPQRPTPSPHSPARSGSH